ncbi:hypothetical protein B0H15DRAFT_1004680 [Mycena belliarum]|uniref:Uncharacterized protein n=1 Tax=Mycena belliarum TaxID=1033014 RepID=A0AAD6TR73_9AGAR|nr:hypothetical protein B0H15DRAFT_1004680 [Mycena belliae]
MSRHMQVHSPAPPLAKGFATSRSLPPPPSMLGVILRLSRSHWTQVSSSRTTHGWDAAYRVVRNEEQAPRCLSPSSRAMLLCTAAPMLLALRTPPSSTDPISTSADVDRASVTNGPDSVVDDHVYLIRYPALRCASRPLRLPTGMDDLEKSLLESSRSPPPTVSRAPAPGVLRWRGSRCLLSMLAVSWSKRFLHFGRAPCAHFDM